ncbi:replication factor C subunit 1 [Halocaridina rubra]|uniref:Replication factor C subunit 1 n=1 Tax=Halocaridina rubra TaxID=373956 RepID=A0AAN8X6Q1_HALRR
MNVDLGIRGKVLNGALPPRDKLIMDIRNYFSPVGGKKLGKTSSARESKRKTVIIDSDEEEPFPSKRKQQKILVSDSDDDMFEPKKAQKTPPSKKEEKHKKKLLPKPPTEKLKPTSASDFFSKSTVVRKENTALIAKKKKIEEVVTVHSDDDFAATLEALDQQQKCSNKSKPTSNPVSHVEENPTHNDHSSSNVTSGNSKLASKLSALKHKTEKKSEAREGVSEWSLSRDRRLKDDDNKSQVEKKRKHLSESDKESRNERDSDANDLKHKKVKISPRKEEKSKITPKEEHLHSEINQVKKEKRTPDKEDKKEERERKYTPSKKESAKKQTGLKEAQAKEERITPKKAENASDADSTLQPEDKKKNSRAAYFKFLQRAGPSNPGSKPIPDGAPGCLQGMTFVVTGVLDSLDREETSELVKKYGGKVTTSVSRNTTYLVVGNEPGESKIKKAQQFGTKNIDEDGLLDLIRTLPGKGGHEENKSNNKGSASKKLKVFERDTKGTISAKDASPSNAEHKSKAFPSKAEPKSKASPSKVEPKLKASPNKAESTSSPVSLLSYSQTSSKSQVIGSPSSISSNSSTQPLSTQDLSDRSGELLMWVDKYKPASIKNIIGQQGDKSNVRKLLFWLQNWKKNQSGDKKLVRPSPWAKADDGAFFKCALLSGPPGVGKTTTAHLVCKEAGFDFVELNASDARSKKCLDEIVSKLLSNQSLAGFVKGKSANSLSENHALVMDEVDGMSGNEDRGGVQELIALIKKSRVPIIAMCNDRNHPKIRSLANHCFDLRFNKPRIEQIRGPMMSVCFREGIKINPDALDEIIMGANQDLRQIMHHLSMWSANEKNLVAEDMKKEAEKSKKNFKLGPWDVCKKVFTASDHKTMSIYDKSDLFFHDYSISPLFVQENFPKAVPHLAKGNRRVTMELLAKTAGSLADGDLVERAIRTRNSWSLLPVQAMYSSVLPGEYMSGHLSAQIEFPKWLGNNSRRNKFDRLMQELQMHMRLRISGSKLDVCMDYTEPLRNAITTPLAKQGSEGVHQAVEVMNTYHLLREDLDSIMELAQWPDSRDPMSNIDSKVKAAFTRAFNKESHMTPFAPVVFAKKKKGGSTGGDAYGDEEDGEDEDEDDEDDITKNAMIKVKKGGRKKDEAASSKGRGGATSKSSGSRGRGRGKK